MQESEKKSLTENTLLCNLVFYMYLRKLCIKNFFL